MAYNRQISGNKNYSFAQVPQVTVPRSKFNRSSNVKTTFNAGDLVPIFLDELLPGDTVNLKMDSIIRTNTFINPIMDNIYINTFWFFVPCRLVWDNWERFQGAQDNPADTIAYTIPQVTATNQPEGSIWDYMGLPTRVANPLSVNALPFRAYNLIYNEWFRSQDIINSRPVPTGDGPDTIAPTYAIQKRMKRADYFTRCLPWPQKGGAAQLLPLGTSAPVISTSVAGVKQPIIFENLNGNVQFNAQGVAGTPTIQRAGGNFAATGNIGLFTPSNVIADLSQATAATINDLRQAFQIQRLLERDARSGSRYQESIKAHFGVSSPDARLQRPEIISIGQSMVMVNPVANTNNVSPNIQAELAAYGVASISNHGFTYSSTEHGYVIGLINARADLTYWQGINKLWTRTRRYDFYMPVLSHLGEQPVLTQEIYAQGTAADSTVFGYQERWAEYRYKPSQVIGLFKPTATPLNLSDWHLAQNFGAAPTLNSNFMVENPPMSRVFNSLTAGIPDFWADIHYTYMCARPMPLYSVPGLIDHF